MINGDSPLQHLFVRIARAGAFACVASRSRARAKQNTMSAFKDAVFSCMVLVVTRMARRPEFLLACFFLSLLRPSHAVVIAPRIQKDTSGFHVVSASEICVNAPPAANFTNSAYEGTWFEIAKYQTAGGAFFERNCVCTEVEVAPLPAPSPDFSAHFSCRDKLPSGEF